MMPVSDSDPSSMPEQSTDELGESSNVLDAKLESKIDEPLKDKNSSKENYYIKKRIIAAINRSLKSNDKTVQHTFALNDDEKDDLKNRQSVTIIVKRIDLDKESIFYTREKDVPDVINLDAFKIEEISSRDSKHNSSRTSSKHSSSNNESKHHHSTNHGSKHNLTNRKSKHNSTNNSKHNSADSELKHNSTKGESKDKSASNETKHNSHRSTNKKRSSDDHHRSDRHGSNSHHSSSKKQDERRSERKHISEETLKSPVLLCHSCGRKENKKWVHPDCTNKCCRSTAYYCDSCLRHKIVKNDHNNELIRNVNFSKYMYVVACPTGRGRSLHMDYDRILHLRSTEQREVATEFLKQAFKEDDKGFAHFTIAIVHNGAKYMPDMLKMLAKLHPTLKVNTTKLKSSTETELTDLLTYYKKVKETYNNGTYAYDPLNETQAACVKNADECGAYLPEMLSLLEKSPFLSQVLPWGDFTTKRYQTPHESDDGPIFWCRPGEQIVSLDRNNQRSRWNSSEIESFLKERKKNICLNDERKLIVEELKKYRRCCSAREFLFEDRTRPHADQAWSNSFEATAAVGVIQAIHPEENPDYNRICKEIVVFQAKHLEMLEALLHIDTTAAPKQQCAEWLNDAKLNMIRQMNIQFSKLHLRDNDIYFIPRKIVHQFKTVSATLSIAWHTRIREYYEGKETETNHIEMPSSLPNEKTSDKKKQINKNLLERSRSSSVGSQSRHSKKYRKKRKLKSHRSHSPCKRIKEEPIPSDEDKYKLNKTDVDSVCQIVSNNCCSVPVLVKVEPKNETKITTGDTQSEKGIDNGSQYICPRVEIVDIGIPTHSSTNPLKCDAKKTDKINDVEMKFEKNTEILPIEPTVVDANLGISNDMLSDEKTRNE